MFMTVISLSSKGQLTLPEGVRKKLGLSKGDMLAVVEKDGQIILSPVSVLPVKMYTDTEIAEWDEENDLTADEAAAFDAGVDRLKAKLAKPS